MLGFLEKGENNAAVGVIHDGMVPDNGRSETVSLYNWAPAPRRMRIGGDGGAAGGSYGVRGRGLG